MLNSVFPDDWADAPLAVIWMLGNAARFADPDTNGVCTPAFAQNWLDRLIDSEGNPRDEFGRSLIEGIIDRLVLEVALLKSIADRVTSPDVVRATLVAHLTEYADSLVTALYERQEDDGDEPA